jgi:glycosyltransferase A (GT-A) superfamily protein (DUF2064 family)
MAKAPVAGRVKTRLAREVGHDVAARLALLALLDTVAVCTEAFGSPGCTLALDGDLATVDGGAELTAALDGWTVIAQRGDGLAERIVAAHAYVSGDRRGHPLLQIGMDTPQLSAADLLGLVAESGSRTVALGPATDGGWWGIAHRDAGCLLHVGGVPMSRADTAERTRAAVERAGFAVVLGDTRRDVDTVADALAVAAEAPRTRFAQGVRDHLLPESVR